MGDRGVIEIIDPQNDNKVCLYTHWSGSDLDATLAKALDRGRERWNDSSYLTRIIFNEMTKGFEMDTAGFGIYPGDGVDSGPDNPVITMFWWRSNRSGSHDLYTELRIQEEGTASVPAEEWVKRFEFAIFDSEIVR